MALRRASADAPGGARRAPPVHRHAETSRSTGCSSSSTPRSSPTTSSSPSRSTTPTTSACCRAAFTSNGRSPLAAARRGERSASTTTTRCFEPFPFPAATDEQTEDIRRLGEAIDAHRKARQAEHPGLGLTDLYNAVEALRLGRDLTAKEQRSADDGLAHTLLDLHRRLDRAVLDAYGWCDLDAEAPTFRAAVLDRLVALNAERRAEEEAGTVRYLRPAFQNPGASGQGGLDLRTPAPQPSRTSRTRARGPTRSPRGPSPCVRPSPPGPRRRPRSPPGSTGPRRGRAEEVLDALAELGLVQHVGDAFTV